MTLTVITHTTHVKADSKIYAYGPYVKEINLWLKHVESAILVAPIIKQEKSKIYLPYQNESVEINAIPSISFNSSNNSISSLFKLPFIIYQIFMAMWQADHIHLRCPGIIGLLGCVIQILFPFKSKTAKYAGNWDPNSIQPLSYRLQKWILSNTFLTKNMQVLVYGEWPDQSKNIKPFFTATYRKAKSLEVIKKDFNAPFKILFVGSLVKGKRPLYAINLVHQLHKKEMECQLEIYGDGPLKNQLQTYIEQNNLTEIVTLHGNETPETIEKAYKRSHFVILPSKSEGWPKVVAEAMFWGAIPLVTSISCVPWMIGYGERGVLLELTLEDDTSKILALLKSNDKLKDLSSQGKIWSRNYTLDRMEVEIIKLLNEGITTN